MNRDFPKQLKRLSSIEPDAAFLARSKATILSLERGGRVGVRTYLAAWATSFALIVLLVVGYALLPLFTPGRSNSLPIASAETLSNELQGMSINIALNEVSYNNQVSQTIDNTITAITSNKAPHLNTEVLQSEGSKLTTGVSATSTDEQINDLLNQISQ